MSKSLLIAAAKTSIAGVADRMTLYEVIHGVAFAQAFNFYMQQRRLIPPGALNVEGRIAFSQDLEEAQDYAQAQADLAWVRYQKFSPDIGWADETTDTYIGRDVNGALRSAPPVETRPRARPPIPPRPGCDPTSLKRTVRIPPVPSTAGREWKSEEEPPPPLGY